VADVKTRVWFPVLAVLLATLIPYLLAEGVYALVKGRRAETSLGYSFYSQWFAARHHTEADPLDASTLMLTDVGQIEPLLGLMKANGFGLGNSPFSELETQEAAVNERQGDCLVQKPGLRKTVGFLRGNLFDPFDQVTFFYDADRELPAELEAFLRRYAFRRVAHSTNAAGERNTFPPVESARKVLIAGDSVANGLMLDDRETLASQIQSHDGSRQYVNLGIAGAAAADTVCALERAAARYHGSIDELIYVLCENDWSESEKYGQPDALIDWIEGFRTREAIPHVTFLYVPYIYNTAPELTRLRGHKHFEKPTYHDEKHRALERAHSAGFKVVDFLDIANEERDRLGTQFASLALYVDHIHFSRSGVERLLPRLLESMPTPRRVVQNSPDLERAGAPLPNGG